MFRQSCLTIRSKFIQWMGRLGGHFDSPEWWSLPISSKSPYLGQLFLSLASFEMIRTYLSTHAVRELFLVVEPPALAAVLESSFRSEGIPVRRHLGRPAGSLRWAWKDFKRYVAPRCYFLLDELRKRWRLRRCPNAALDHGPDEPVTLLRTWFFGSSYMNGLFKDAYFNHLAEWLETKGRRVLTVFSLFDAADVDSLAALLMQTKSRRSCVTLEQLVGVWDVLKIFVKTLFPPSIQSSDFDFRWNGVDIRPLVEAEIRHVRFDPGFVFSLFHRRMVERLRQRGVRLDAVYVPFENQSWEKSFFQELKRLYPDVWIGGYQHAAVFDLLLTYEMSAAEMELSPKPDAILASGDYFADFFRKRGYSDVRVVYPVKYASLEKKWRQVSTEAQSNPSYDFLICTPAGFFDTLDMVHRLTRLFAGQSCRVAVKTHQLVDWEAVKSTLSTISVTVPPEWESVTGAVGDLIATSRTICWVSSSVYMDALLLGKPALHIIPSHSFDIEWIDLPEGCIHVHPEDTYEALMEKLQSVQSTVRSAAVSRFVRDRLAFHERLDRFLPVEPVAS